MRNCYFRGVSLHPLLFSLLVAVLEYNSFQNPLLVSGVNAQRRNLRPLVPIDRPTAPPPLVAPWVYGFSRSPRPRDLMPSFPFIASLALFQCSNKEAGKN